MRKLSETQLSTFISSVLDKNLKDLDLFITLGDIDIVENFEPREFSGGFEAKIKGLEGEVSIYRSSDRFSDDWTPEKGYTIISRKMVAQCDEKGSITKVDKRLDLSHSMLDNECIMTFIFRRSNVKLEDIESTLDELKRSYERMVDLIDDSKIDKSNRQSEAVKELSTLAGVLKQPEIKPIEFEPAEPIEVEPTKLAETRLSRF